MKSSKKAPDKTKEKLPNKQKCLQEKEKLMIFANLIVDQIIAKNKGEKGLVM